MIRNFNAPAQNKTNNRKTSAILAATVVCPFKLSITKIKRWLFPKLDGINEELTKHTRSNDQIKQTILLQ